MHTQAPSPVLQRSGFDTEEPQAIGKTMSPVPFQLSADDSAGAPSGPPLSGTMPAPALQLTTEEGPPSKMRRSNEAGDGVELNADGTPLVQDVASDDALAAAGGGGDDNGDGGGGSSEPEPAGPSANISNPNITNVEFLASHAMNTYGGNNRNNPLWTPGSGDHAAAYTMNTNPNVRAQITFGDGSAIENADAASVRVKEGDVVRGQADNVAITNAGIEVNPINLVGLTGSDAMRQQTNTLTWELTVDGGNWINLGNSGGHLLYWLVGAPTTANPTTFAIDKITRYVNGNADPVTAIRTGLRGEINYDPADPINADPLSVYNDGVAICTDFGNLLVLLAKNAGYNANTVMFWGGFEYAGRPIWICEGGSFVNLHNTRALDNAYHPGGGAAGWNFNYHVIARIAGNLQDAALNRPGYEATAVHAGKQAKMIQLAPGAMPDATVGTAYSEEIPRFGHNIDVTLKEYGERVVNADFNNILPLKVPVGAPSPISIGVGWAAGAGLPAGLAIDPNNARITGTPTAAGNTNFDLTTNGAGMTDTGAYSINVNAAP